jgi:peptidyl-tRNA hydrolase
MYIFANRGLRMSAGKLSAQVAHGAVRAYEISDEKLIKEWNKGGHYTKLVMLARDNDHIKTIQKYIEDRGYKTALIIDEGLTEIKPHQPTALGVEIVDKEDENVEATFSTFELYRDTIKVTIEADR